MLALRLSGGAWVCMALLACLDGGSNPQAAAKARADSQSSWRRQYGHFLDSLSAIPTYFEPFQAPDAASSMHLVTKCINNVVYYRFWIVASPEVFTRFRRTMSLVRKDEPIFTASLLDSAGFNIATIEMPHDALGVEFSNRTVSANDRIKLPCEQYRELARWLPGWRSSVWSAEFH
jgi:hypothetical protein